MLRPLLAAYRLAHSFFRREDGSIVPLFALAIVPVIGFVGASIDYTRANGLKAKLQSALDAAVIVGARDGTSNRDAIAQQTFGANVAAQTNAAATATFTLNADGSYTGTATAAVATDFMGLLGVSSVNLAVKATAAVATKPAKPFCVMALNTTEPAALQLSGNSSVQISAPDCTIMVNSNAVPAVDTSGTASINSAENCFVGTTRSIGNSSVTPSPDAACKPKPDPFANKYDKPTPGPCDHTDFSASDGTVTPQPGVYCGGIKISGQTTVTFSPGFYIVKDGVLSSSGGSVLTGNGVTFFLTGAGAGLQISGTADWHLVASSSGPFPGFIFFLDPTSASGNAASTSTLSGSGELYFEGIIYLPQQQLTVTGNGTTLAAAPFTSYIADTLKFNGNGSLTINMDLSKTTVPIPAAILAGTGGLLRLVN